MAELVADFGHMGELNHQKVKRKRNKSATITALCPVCCPIAQIDIDRYLEGNGTPGEAPGAPGGHHVSAGAPGNARPGEPKRRCALPARLVEAASTRLGNSAHPHLVRPPVSRIGRIIGAGIAVSTAVFIVVVVVGVVAHTPLVPLLPAALATAWRWRRRWWWWCPVAIVEIKNIPVRLLQLLVQRLAACHTS